MSRSPSRPSRRASMSTRKSRSGSISMKQRLALGGAHQTARKLIDEGLIGMPIGGTAFFMCPGHERWHPNPGFYFLGGGGPMLDMGPYYITDLVNLLGPVASVSGVATRLRETREITRDPLKG